jgi:acyl carrier protein
VPELWYVALVLRNVGRSAGMRFYEAEAVAPIRDRILQRIRELLGVNKDRVTTSSSFLADLGADSLDIVELAMEFEELGVTITDGEAERIKTVGDLIDHVSRSKL